MKREYYIDECGQLSEQSVVELKKNKKALIELVRMDHNLLKYFCEEPFVSEKEILIAALKNQSSKIKSIETKKAYNFLIFALEADNADVIEDVFFKIEFATNSLEKVLEHKYFKYFFEKQEITKTINELMKERELFVLSFKESLSKKELKYIFSSKENTLYISLNRNNFKKYIVQSKYKNDIDVVLALLKNQMNNIEIIKELNLYKKIYAAFKGSNIDFANLSSEERQYAIRIVDRLEKEPFDLLTKIYPDVFSKIKSSLEVKTKNEEDNKIKKTDIYQKLIASKLSLINFSVQNNYNEKEISLVKEFGQNNKIKENLEYEIQEKQKREKLILVAKKIANGQLTIRQYCDNEATTYPLSYLIHYLEDNKMLKEEIVKLLFTAKLNNEIDTKDIIKLLTRRKGNLDFKFYYDLNNVKLELLKLRPMLHSLDNNIEFYKILNSIINSLSAYNELYNREELINQKFVYQKYDSKTNNIIKVEVLDHHYDNASSNLITNNSIICRKTVTDEAIKVAITEFMKENLDLKTKTIAKND